MQSVVLVHSVAYIGFDARDARGQRGKKILVRRRLEAMIETRHGALETTPVSRHSHPTRLTISETAEHFTSAVRDHEMPAKRRHAYPFRRKKVLQTRHVLIFLTTGIHKSFEVETFCTQIRHYIFIGVERSLEVFVVVAVLAHVQDHVTGLSAASPLVYNKAAHRQFL